MAKILLGPVVIGIRGTVGGITFSANKAGPYARSWSKGSNPQSTKQTEQRARLSSLPNSWRILTPAQQTAWDTFAALPAQELTDSLGETYVLSGYGWYVKTNTRNLVMGDPLRSAVPTIARPPAPTISSVQLPFLPGQIAKVVYPAGEFSGSLRSVIQTGLWQSAGRTVTPSKRPLMKTNLTPPDTDDAFQAQYLETFGTPNANQKGFIALYRQTSEGIRSSPAVASFVSGDNAPYSDTARDYNGTTMISTRGADLTGNADSKVCLASFWFRPDGGDGTLRTLALNTGTHYRFQLQADDTLQVILQDATTSAVLVANTTTTFVAATGWHNVIWSIDLSTSSVQLFVDGIQETPSISTGPINIAIDWTRPDHWYAATPGPIRLFDGCLAEAYLNNQITIDLSLEFNLRAFISETGEAVDLGANGSFPTNSQPIIYFRNGDAAVNLGSGGNFVNAVALTTCSDEPAP